jgi:hypothetical protein
VNDVFSRVSNEVASRTLASQQFVAHIGVVEKSDPPLAIALKGMAFVLFYASYEYAVRASVQATLFALKGTPVELSRLRREVLALVLDPAWTQVSTVGRPRKWDCRIDLMSRADSSETTADISDALFPTDGSHFRVQQLATIWRVLGIAAPLVPDPRLLGRIAELVENRNAISHGRKTAAEVGRAYSLSDIAARGTDAARIAQNVVVTLQAHHASGALVR